MNSFLPPYSGPAEIADAWSSFAARYTENGKNHTRTRQIALLNELAFEQSAQNFLSAHVQNTITCELLEDEIGAVLRALSNDAHRDVHRPLHRCVMQALLSHWIEAEAKQGLYPPKPLTTDKGGQMESGEKTAIITKREHFLKTQPANFLFGTIAALTDSIMRAESARVYRILKTGGITFDDTLTKAQDILTSSLFAYDENESSFGWYLQSRLKRMLIKGVSADYPFTTSLDGTDIGDARKRAAVVEHRLTRVKHTLPLMEDILAREQDALVRRVLEDFLTPQQQRILSLRSGAETGEALSLAEVAETENLSISQIRTLETKARERFSQGWQLLTRSIPSAQSAANRPRNSGTER